MVGDNKILTVSYGTFSCTLEGFDDPFNTMTNIAEYFRDLAAGDRFFGAEPPQPDPEMLQSIAEQTIQARVNAQLSDSGVVLRQDANQGSGPIAAAPVAAVAAAAVAPQVAPVTAEPSVGAETVAQKLQRIRAVVSRETAQDALFSEDQHVDEFAAETTAPLDAFEETAFEDQDTAPVSVPTVAPQADTQDITDDLAPDAVVETPVAEDATEVEAEAEVETVADTDTSEEIDLSSTVEDVSEEDASEDAIETSMDAAEAEPEVATDEDQTSDTVSEALSDEETSDADADLDATSREDAAETAVDNVLGRTSEDDDAEAATPRRRIVVQKITRDDLRAARKDPAKTVEAKDDAAVAADVTTDTSEETAPATSVSDGELPPEQEEELLRELAALQTGDDDAVAEMTFENAQEVDNSDDDASAEDDLVDALSDLVSEDADGYEQEELSAAREARRARRDAIAEDHEGDVERLISTTSSRIDNDESSKRRASIAHLKAAVAATKADASLTEAAQEAEARERDQYAEDLARVVRPERKTTSETRAKTDRPAPLVLVSELRIDKDQDDDISAAETTDDEAPVRPRRISRDEVDEQVAAEDVNVFTDPDQTSFADYASSTNALELPDLLEAAAAYYTFVESTEQFTRPMLMRKIASISARDGFSREAGLRSFGTLLREGKLVKGSNGKFVIAKSSRFTPEARYAGE